MNRLKSMLILSLVLLGATTSGVSLADGGRGGHGGYKGYGHGGHGGYGHRGYSVGVSIGVPVFSPWFYPPPYYYPPAPYHYPPAPYYYPPSPYYYPPPIVSVPSSPPVYIEREISEPAPPQSSSYWYYCDNPQGYYPYVKQCPAGWQMVAPQPPPPTGER
jgi:hypothetical protein